METRELQIRLAVSRVISAVLHGTRYDFGLEPTKYGYCDASFDSIARRRHPDVSASFRRTSVCRRGHHLAFLCDTESDALTSAVHASSFVDDAAIFCLASTLRLRCRVLTIC